MNIVEEITNLALLIKNKLSIDSQIEVIKELQYEDFQYRIERLDEIFSNTFMIREMEILSNVSHYQYLMLNKGENNTLFYKCIYNYFIEKEPDGDKLLSISEKTFLCWLYGVEEHGRNNDELQLLKKNDATFVAREQQFTLK